jgi:hypothetical protein
MIDTKKFIEIATGLWYEKETGLPWSNKVSGRWYRFEDTLHRLNGKTKDGYYQVFHHGKIFLWHRLVWNFFKGEIPKGLQVDHMNNMRYDNRISNLQLLLCKYNARKRLKQSNNTTGYPGVCFDKRKQKFRSQIKTDGCTKYLGAFDNPEEAYKVYLAAKTKYHGTDSITSIS